MRIIEVFVVCLNVGNKTEKEPVPRPILLLISPVAKNGSQDGKIEFITDLALFGITA